jgi:hypothetical protein
MPHLWGDTEELRELTKKVLEEKIEELLKDKGEVSMNDLFKEFWHSYHQFSQYLQIRLTVEKLVEEAKIIMDENEKFSIAKISFLDWGEIKEVSVWDLEHKKADIEEKKEIIRRYETVDYLA